MEDLIFAPLVVAVSIGLHASILRMHLPREQRGLNLAFGAHLISGVTQVLLVRYYFKGGGDMLGYYQNGVEVAELLRDDAARYLPEVLRAFFQADDTLLPVPLFGGGSTLSMSAAATLLLFALGNSLYAVTLAIATGAYASQVMLYRALRPEFSIVKHEALFWGTNLLPSAVFWSSALLKEPLVMCALGPLVLGLRWMADGKRRGLALAMIIGAAAVIVAIKPYVLMALSLAAGAFYLLRRLQSDTSAALKPFAVVSAVSLAAGGLVLGNKFFLKADADSAATAFANQRAVGYATEGGSNFALEDRGPDAEVENRGFAQELALAPFALLTALFRPFLFEARNAVQLVNALEATALLVLFAQIFRRLSWRIALARIRSSPTLTFCVVFTLALAIGTGLATTNMGTLSRYRAPMMPFFFTVLLLLRQDAQELRLRASRLSPAGAAR